MSLRYHFLKAQKTLSRLTPHDRNMIEKQCQSIRIAEELLQSAGMSAFQLCSTGCKGICCRNHDPDAIIGFSDCILILMLAGHLQEKIATCLKNENLLYTADCIFLLDGKGPCLFPTNIRPEVCITTFCTDVQPVQKAIRSVKWQFMKLNVYLFFLQWKYFFRSFSEVGHTESIKGSEYE